MNVYVRRTKYSLCLLLCRPALFTLSLHRSDKGFMLMCFAYIRVEGGFCFSDAAGDGKVCGKTIAKPYLSPVVIV